MWECSIAGYVKCGCVRWQNKLYPREVDRNVRGRIRVQLKNDDGTPVLPHFPTRQYATLLLGHIPIYIKRSNTCARSSFFSVSV